jgi:NAD(P)-dependent dehydrogenase (short-subunit alcohol dehydrogenase family)
VGSITDNKLGGWYSYRASKVAFNQILHTAAIEHHRRNKKAVFVALQPGTVASPLSSPFVQASKAMDAKESVAGLLRAMGPLEPMSGAHFIDFNGQSIPW